MKSVLQSRFQVWSISGKLLKISNTLDDALNYAVSHSEAYTVQLYHVWVYEDGFEQIAPDESFEVVWCADKNPQLIANEMLNHELSAAYEMAELGVLSGKLHLYIYGGEGPIPHLHFFTNDHSIDGCLRLDKPEYFSHGGRYTSTLKRKQIEELINFMYSPHEIHSDVPNWKIAIVLWNTNNPRCKISIDLKMPDYRLLNS